MNAPSTPSFPISGRRFTVVGAGRSGLAAANLLARHGGDVLLVEARDVPRPDALDNRVAYRSDSNEVREGDIAVLSPGIPEVSPLRAEIAARASEVLGEVELFYRLSPAPILAITGTDGKSTVTTMLGAIMREAGRPTFVGGNLGNPLCDDLDTLTPDHIVVAEVSCFQLTTCRDFRPRVAVVTNIAEDHTDYHGSFAAYQAAKRLIWRAMTSDDVLVLNADDPHIANWSLPDRETGPRLRYFSLTSSTSDARLVAVPEGERREVTNPVDERREVTNPVGERVELTHPVDERLEVTNPVGERIEFTHPVDARLEVTNPVGEHLYIMMRSELPLLGAHNVANALAAAQMAIDVGVSPSEIRAALLTYRALPHRLQRVRIRRGVTWINDSKATSPNAASAALRAIRAPLILLAGGSSKDADFNPFAELVRATTRHVVCFGETRHQIARALGDHPHTIVESLGEAVAIADAASHPGDTVLLSPACASFDQFKGYAHRGEVFEGLVNALSE